MNILVYAVGFISNRILFDGVYDPFPVSSDVGVDFREQREVTEITSDKVANKFVVYHQRNAFVALRQKLLKTL